MASRNISTYLIVCCVLITSLATPLASTRPVAAQFDDPICELGYIFDAFSGTCIVDPIAIIDEMEPESAEPMDEYQPPADIEPEPSLSVEHGNPPDDEQLIEVYDLANAFVSIRKHVCPHDAASLESFAINAMLIECAINGPAAQFTLIDSSGTMYSATSAGHAGSVTFADLYGGPVIVQEHPPIGYAPVVVFCSTVNAFGAPSGAELVAIADGTIQLELPIEGRIDCEWFNVEQERAATALTITKRVCPTDLRFVSIPTAADYLQACDEVGADVTFSVFEHLTAETFAGTTSSDGVVTFTDLAGVAYDLIENVPSGMVSVAVFCRPVFTGTASEWEELGSGPVVSYQIPQDASAQCVWLNTFTQESEDEIPTVDAEEASVLPSRHPSTNETLEQGNHRVPGVTYSESVRENTPILSKIPATLMVHPRSCPAGLDRSNWTSLDYELTCHKAGFTTATFVLTGPDGEIKPGYYGSGGHPFAVHLMTPYTLTGMDIGGFGEQVVFCFAGNDGRDWQPITIDQTGLTITFTLPPARYFYCVWFFIPGSPIRTKLDFNQHNVVYTTPAPIPTVSHSDVVREREIAQPPLSASSATLIAVMYHCKFDRGGSRVGWSRETYIEKCGWPKPDSRGLFTLTDRTGSGSSKRSDDHVGFNVVKGAPYTLTGTPPPGYSSHVVFCEVRAPSFTWEALPFTQTGNTIAFTLTSRSTYVCQWFNILESPADIGIGAAGYSPGWMWLENTQYVCPANVDLKALEQSAGCEYYHGSQVVLGPDGREVHMVPWESIAPLVFRLMIGVTYQVSTLPPPGTSKTFVRCRDSHDPTYGTVQFTREGSSMTFKVTGAAEEWTFCRWVHIATPSTQEKVTTKTTLNVQDSSTETITPKSNSGDVYSANVSERMLQVAPAYVDVQLPPTSVVNVAYTCRDDYLDRSSWSLADYLARCDHRANGVPFTITGTPGFTRTVATDGGIATFHNLRRGQYTVTQSVPSGFATPAVSCIVNDGTGTILPFVQTGAAIQVSATKPQNVCYWFNIPLKPYSQSGAGDGGTTLDVSTYACPAGLDRANWGYQDYAKHCRRTMKGASFTLVDAEGVGTVHEPVGDRVTFRALGAGGYTLTENVPAGFGDPVVYCYWFYPHALSTPLNILQDRAEISFNAAGSTIHCVWFNIPTEQ